MTEMELRQKIVNIAMSYLGCKESDGSHKKIIDLYNSHQPLARSYRLQYTDAWCAGFVSAMAIAAGMTEIIPTEVGCGQQIALFQKMGCWAEDDGYVPQPGDVIYYDWSDDGVGDNRIAPDHVGLVTACDGKTITVIEGNKADAVGIRTIAVNGRYIRGFGVPDYAGMATNATDKNVGGKRPVICLSPSNQFGNRYAYGNTNEAEQCQRIADAAAVAFERCGITAVMADNTLGMAEKCRISDEAGADLHWPVHTNAHGKAGETNGGTHMFASSLTGEGGKACAAVLTHLASITPGSTGETVHVNTTWFEIVTPKAPTIYQETEFHDVPEYAKWIIEHVEDIAEEMAKGACDHFGLAYVPPGGQPDEDIGDGHEYSKAARKKAIDNGIITGVGKTADGKTDYAWTRPVTREELVTILDRMVLL